MKSIDFANLFLNIYKFYIISMETVEKNTNPKIEYRVFDFGHMANEKLEHILNKYGDKGWDMCGFDVYQNLPLSNDLRALSIFKRIKQ